MSSSKVAGNLINIKLVQLFEYRDKGNLQKLSGDHGKNSVSIFLSHIREHFFKTSSKEQKQVKPLNLV